jgi:hypothetical protein
MPSIRANAWVLRRIVRAAIFHRTVNSRQAADTGLFPISVSQARWSKIGKR